MIKVTLIVTDGNSKERQGKFVFTDGMVSAYIVGNKDENRLQFLNKMLKPILGTVKRTIINMAEGKLN